jgi:hypothetical protein
MASRFIGESHAQAGGDQEAQQGYTDENPHSVVLPPLYQDLTTNFHFDFATDRQYTPCCF